MTKIKPIQLIITDDENFRKVVDCKSHTDANEQFSQYKNLGFNVVIIKGT